MTDYKPKPKFTDNILELSRTEDIEEVKKEWKFVRKYESPFRDKRCLCHSTIKNQFYFVNKFTAKIIAVGETCAVIFQQISKRRYIPPRYNTSRYITDLNEILGDKELPIEIDLTEYCIENYHRIIELYKERIDKLPFCNTVLDDYSLYLNIEWKDLFNINPLLEYIEEKKLELIELIKKKEINIKIKQNELYKFRYKLVVEEIKEKRKYWDYYRKRKQMKRGRLRLKKFIHYHLEVYNSDAYLDYNSE